MLGELTRENLKQLDPAAAGEEGEARPEGQTHDEIDSLYNLAGGFGSWQGATDRPS